MATLYFDTSALVKLYVAEPGSEWVDAIIAARDAEALPTHVIATSRLALVEVAAAIARRVRLGQLTKTLGRQIIADFMTHCRDRFLTLAMLDPQLRLAMELVERQPLRGYDAMHLAAALDLDRHLSQARLSELTFVTADVALCTAARFEGLAAVNPNDGADRIELA